MVRVAVKVAVALMVAVAVEVVVVEWWRGVAVKVAVEVATRA